MADSLERGSSSLRSAGLAMRRKYISYVVI